MTGHHFRWSGRNRVLAQRPIKSYPAGVGVNAVNCQPGHIMLPVTRHQDSMVDTPFSYRGLAVGGPRTGYCQDKELLAVATGPPHR
jgi:hypothetical protein